MKITLLREPLLHFLVIGAAVFALFAVLDDAPSDTNVDRIEIAASDRDRLIAQFEAVWRRKPTAVEREGLVQDLIREEVLVREALLLGLEDGDSVVRRRLRQKMEFLTAPTPEALEPDEEALLAHLRANEDRFLVPGTVSFSQVFLGEEMSDADRAVLQEELRKGSDPQSLGRRSLLPFDMRSASKAAVDAVFGTGYFAALEDLSPGLWQGPVRSGFGDHLVRIETAHPARLPELSEVYDAVLADWSSSRIEAIREERFQKLLSRYEVIRRDLGDEE